MNARFGPGLKKNYNTLQFKYGTTQPRESSDVTVFRMLNELKNVYCSNSTNSTALLNWNVWTECDITEIYCTIVIVVWVWVCYHTGFWIYINIWHRKYLNSEIHICKAVAYATTVPPRQSYGQPVGSIFLLGKGANEQTDRLVVKDYIRPWAPMRGVISALPTF